MSKEDNTESEPVDPALSKFLTNTSETTSMQAGYELVGSMQPG